MDADYEKSLATPSPDGPQFRPTKGYLRVMGTFVVFAGLLFCGIGWLYGFKLPEMMTANEAEDLVGIDITASMLSFGFSISTVGLGLLILGIGSIALKRWARDLLFATGWLLIGFAILVGISMLMTVPQMIEMQQTILGSTGGSATKATSAMMVGIMAISAIIYVLIIAVPGVLLILVYRSKNVELTTRYFDQKPSWTEKCHVSVLALWLFNLFGFITIISMTYGYPEIIVKFGILPSKAITIGIIVGIAVYLLFILFGLSRLATWSWWASVIYLVLCLLASVHLFYNSDITDTIAEIFGAPAGEENEATDSVSNFYVSNVKTNFYTGFVTLLAMMGYLFFIRKHFFHSEKEAIQ